MKVLCIDDKFKPNEISKDNWIVMGETYTVVKMVKNKLRGNYGFVLEEVQPNTPEYFGYDVRRFGIELVRLNSLVEKGEITVEVMEQEEVES